MKWKEKKNYQKLTNLIFFLIELFLPIFFFPKKKKKLEMASKYLHPLITLNKHGSRNSVSA